MLACFGYLGPREPLNLTAVTRQERFRVSGREGDSPGGSIRNHRKEHVDWMMTSRFMRGYVIGTGA